MGAWMAALLVVAPAAFAVSKVSSPQVTKDALEIEGRYGFIMTMIPLRMMPSIKTSPPIMASSTGCAAVRAQAVPFSP